MVKIKKGISLQGRGKYAVKSSKGFHAATFRTKANADKFVLEGKKKLVGRRLGKKQLAIVRSIRVVKITR